MLRTWDVSGSVNFYVEVLGFAVKGMSGDQGWACVERDGVAVMFSAPNAHEGDTSPCFTGSIYFDCDQVDQLWDAVKNRARVCYPIEDFDYGMREFGIYDNNGYLLQFGNSLSR
jgi:uncharacterized glyoxalase superfamily protein PhnB